VADGEVAEGRQQPAVDGAAAVKVPVRRAQSDDRTVVVALAEKEGTEVLDERRTVPDPRSRRTPVVA